MGAEAAAAASEMEGDQAKSNDARKAVKDTATVYQVSKREMDRKAKDAESLGREAEEKNRARVEVISQREQAQMSHLAGQQDKERLIQDLRDISNDVTRMRLEIKEREVE
jgi:hypothetical protein